VRGDPRTAGVPLLVWGRRGARDEEVDAFAAGADDYISGSPPIGTLVARLHAVSRRSRGTSQDVTAPPDQAIRIGALTVEPDSYRLKIDGQSVALTAGEFRLLWMLAVHAGTVVTNDQLAHANQRGHEVLSDKSIRSFIASLRRKMGPTASLLRTVRGVGYRLAEG
jgi:DNA-binding response OmpR family regulator